MKAQVSKMLDDMGPPDPAMAVGDDPEGDGDQEGMEAAAESAIEDFFAAGKRGDFKGAYSALKEAVGYCNEG